MERMLGELILHRTAQLLERRLDRPAMRMPEHHHQTRTELRRREFHAADERGGHDVARDTNDEQIAEPLIEHDLRRHARIGAAENDRKGLLILHQLHAWRSAERRLLLAQPLDESAVSFLQTLQCFGCGDHGRKVNKGRGGRTIGPPHGSGRRAPRSASPAFAGRGR